MGQESLLYNKWCLSEGPVWFVFCSHREPDKPLLSLTADPSEGKHTEDKFSHASCTWQCKTLSCRNSKKESDLNVAQARVRDLDAQLNAKEADLATALNENRTLENELRELKDQVLSVRLAVGI